MPLNNQQAPSVESASQIARKLETLTGTDKLDTGALKNNDVPIASPTVLGGVKISDGLEADASGALSVKVASGIKLDASKNIVIDAPNIDVTTLNKADTLVSSVYQDALNASSTFVTLTNATKGSWWNVAAEVTIGGIVFSIGDQLWCRANVTGIPVNLTNFVRVPASVAIATTTSFGTVKYSDFTPQKSQYLPLPGTSQFVSRADHTHQRNDFLVQIYNSATDYIPNETVRRNNLYWKANGTIPALTPFTEGTTGATWRVMKFPVRHDDSGVVGSFGIDNTGIYFEDGLTL